MHEEGNEPVASVKRLFSPRQLWGGVQTLAPFLLFTFTFVVHARSHSLFVYVEN
jgi:hypothetical protein